MLSRDDDILKTAEDWKKAGHGVALATGSILDERNTKLLTAEGESANSEGWPTLGFGIDTDPALSQFNPLNLFEGRWPAAEDPAASEALPGRHIASWVQSWSPLALRPMPEP